MEVMPGILWRLLSGMSIKEIISRHDDRGSAAVGNIERFAFYDEAKLLYAIVATGEMAAYAKCDAAEGRCGRIKGKNEEKIKQK